jgi:hypothetical protein
MSHETREGRKISDELRHNHFDAAHKEISHEMHSHPKEFENTLKSINSDLAKHNQSPLSVERDSKDQVSHINFNNHDIYSSKTASQETTGVATADRANSAVTGGPADITAPVGDRSAAPAAQPTPTPERQAQRETEESRTSHEHERQHHSHHSKHHKHHKHHHGKGGSGEGNENNEEKEDSRDISKTDGAGASDRPGDAAKDGAGVNNPTGRDGKPQDGKSSSPDSDGLHGRDNNEKAMNYFMDKGLTKAQAAGIVGNFDHEAPGVNPSQHQHGGGPGYGIAQWEGARKSAEKQYAKEQGKPANDLKTQLDFAWKEMNSTHRGALAAIERAHTPTQAARAFERGFEAASKPHMHAREQNALLAFNRTPDFSSSDILAAGR